MKRSKTFLLSFIVVAILAVGCSDKMEQTSSLLSSPELAGIQEANTQLSTLIVDEEVWDGESQLEKGKLYRIEGMDNIRKALANEPEVLADFEQQFAASSTTTRNKSNFSHTITRAEVLEKAERLLSGRPEILERLKRKLSAASFPYTPVQKVPEPIGPRQFKIAVRSGNLDSAPTRESEDKVKTTETGSRLASVWANLIALCEHATDIGTNGWIAYPSPVRKWVGTDGYLACNDPGHVLHPVYREFVSAPSYQYLWSYDWGYIYDPGVEASVDAGLYETLNGVTLTTNCTIHVLDYGLNTLYDYIDSDSEAWPYIQKGDCDFDGNIDIFDFLQCMSWQDHDPDPTPGNQQHAGDVDDDGDCDIYDAVAILDMF